MRLSNPDEYQSIVDAEWRIIYEKLEKIAESGAQVRRFYHAVFRQLPLEGFGAGGERRDL